MFTAAGFTAREWSVQGGNIIATKEWSKKDPKSNMEEKGQFILFHHPGQ